MTDETEVVQTVADVAAASVEPTPAVADADYGSMPDVPTALLGEASYGSVSAPKVASPEGVHSALESLEAKFAEFGDWFKQKLADARSHL